MIFYAIFENGFVSKIKATDYDDAMYQYDNASIVEDGNAIVVNAKEAKAIISAIKNLQTIK